MTDSPVLIQRYTSWQRIAGVIGVIGLVLSAIGFVADRHQFFQSWLYGSLFWTGISIGSLGLYLLHNVVGGNWGAIIRRFLEAGAKNIPFSGILLAPILFGMPALYSWARPEAAHDPIVAHKFPYLNTGFFSIRFVGYFLIWTFFAYRLSSRTDLQDKTGDPGIQEKMRAFSSPSLLVFVLCATFGFFDWVMSLEPDWYSTIYGLMFIIGQVLATLAFCLVLLVRSSEETPFREHLNTPLYHDLGNLMLAFTMLWAYLSFSQFLIIWAGNLPDEIPWYLRRFTNGWGYVAWTVSVFHFCVPFFLLLQRFVKKDPRLLYTICLYMFAMRALDMFWLIEPPIRPVLSLHWMDVTSLAGVGGAWLYLFFRTLKARPLLPLHDARLEKMVRVHRHA